MLDALTATPDARTAPPLPAVRSLADRDEYGPITGRPGGLFTASAARSCSASATTSAAASPTGCPPTTCSRPPRRRPRATRPAAALRPRQPAAAGRSRARPLPALLTERSVSPSSRGAAPPEISERSLMASARTILLAEEDPAIAGFLADNLVADGYRVLVADDKTAALELLERAAARPRALRRQRRHAGPARRRPRRRRPRQPDRARHAADRADRARRRARARALLRPRRRRRDRQALLLPRAARPHRRAAAPHLRAPATDRLRVGAITIDPASRQVRVGETPVELSRKEFALLRTLAAEPTRVFTKHELLRDVWGFRCRARTRTLDSHACRLRAKLSAAGDRHWIENVWGVGYRLVGVDPDTRGGSAA